MSYTLTSNWLPADKYALKAPYPMTPEGLIVHNTAGSASAMEEAQAMCTNDSAVSFHVVIDEENAVECIPFSRNAFHAGDGSAGYANRHLIGIEIARSMDAESDRFDRAEENAAEYIAHVCLQYGWTSKQLHQHNWYSATECPHRTKAHWSDFLAKVDANIAELRAQASANPAAPATPAKIALCIDNKNTEVRGENKNGTVYVSARDLLEALGYSVSWEDGQVVAERRSA